MDPDTPTHLPVHPEEFSELYEEVRLTKDKEEETNDFPGICDNSNSYTLVT